MFLTSSDINTAEPNKSQLSWSHTIQYYAVKVGRNGYQNVSQKSSKKKQEILAKKIGKSCKGNKKILQRKQENLAKKTGKSCKENRKI